MGVVVTMRAEDPLPPEQLGHFNQLRSQTTVPLAMGELFTNVNEFLPLVSQRLIDFIRVHLSDLGGLTVRACQNDTHHIIEREKSYTIISTI